MASTGSTTTNTAHSPSSPESPSPSLEAGPSNPPPSPVNGSSNNSSPVKKKAPKSKLSSVENASDLENASTASDSSSTDLTKPKKKKKKAGSSSPSLSTPKTGTGDDAPGVKIPGSPSAKKKGSTAKSSKKKTAKSSGMPTTADTADATESPSSSSSTSSSSASMTSPPSNTNGNDIPVGSSSSTALAENTVRIQPVAENGTAGGKYEHAVSNGSAAAGTAEDDEDEDDEDDDDDDESSGGDDMDNEEDEQSTPSAGVIAVAAQPIAPVILSDSMPPSEPLVSAQFSIVSGDAATEPSNTVADEDEQEDDDGHYQDAPVTEHKRRHRTKYTEEHVDTKERIMGNFYDNDTTTTMRAVNGVPPRVSTPGQIAASTKDDTPQMNGIIAHDNSDETTSKPSIDTTTISITNTITTTTTTSPCIDTSGLIESDKDNRERDTNDSCAVCGSPAATTTADMSKASSTNLPPIAEEEGKTSVDIDEERSPAEGDDSTSDGEQISSVTTKSTNAAAAVDGGKSKPIPFFGSISKRASWTGSISKNMKRWSMFDSSSGGSNNSLNNFPPAPSSPVPESADSSNLTFAPDISVTESTSEAVLGRAFAGTASLSKRFGKALLRGLGVGRSSSSTSMVPRVRPNDDKESEHSTESRDEDETSQNADGDDSAVDLAKLPPLPKKPAGAPILKRPEEDGTMRPRKVVIPVDPNAAASASIELLTTLPEEPVETFVTDLNVRFNEIVTVRRTWARKDYDRKGEVTWKLTPEKAMEIRNELNSFKREMSIHEESRHNTHFY